MAEPETGFLIDDVVHPIPTWPSFTTDEWLVLYEYCELTALDFLTAESLVLAGEEEDPGIAKKMAHPGMMKALMHIAYQRSNPHLKKQKVEALIGSANYLDAIQTVFKDEGDAEDPPASESTSKPPAASSNDSENLRKSSGPDSPNGSAEQDSSPENTGTTRSATSSLRSVRETSAA